MNPFEYDFGYAWQYSYIHLIPLAIGILVVVLSLRFKRSRWITGVGALVACWGLAGLLILQFGIRINLPLELPTDQFVASGRGRVLDVGAGSGRAAIAVLRNRPQTTVVALDWFKGGYGIEENTADRLYDNAATAGVRDRIEVQSADMRDMPFESESFDAAVSSYAIDHMRHEDSKRALNEVHRVLRPGGEFLLAVMQLDAYVRVALPIAGIHGHAGPMTTEQRWRTMLEESQFEVVESGTMPATVYVLARKGAASEPVSKL
jgi:ubiquinone/menaquinone biosynthesis C-methylase UbiE